jgi:hypothetical protein
MISVIKKILNILLNNITKQASKQASKRRSPLFCDALKFNISIVIGGSPAYNAGIAAFLRAFLRQWGCGTAPTAMSTPNKARNPLALRLAA